MFNEEIISLCKSGDSIDCFICCHPFQDEETAINLGSTFGWKAQHLCCIPCKDKHEDDILGFYRGAEAYFWELIQDSLDRQRIT